MPAMKSCWYCEAQLPDDAGYCQQCGHSQTQRNTTPLFVVDSTTGLFNSVFLQAMIDQEANRALRYHRPLSVLIVEIDHIVDIVVDIGPDQTKALLKELAQTLVTTVRDTDTVGFLENEDEPRFAVVLTETDQAGSLLAADKLRRGISAHDFDNGGHWRRLTLSCGAATFNSERIGHQDLFATATHALDSGRATGPNRTHAAAQL
jgi:diguanylate cyclase (GGDEF)-like protein